MSGHEQRLLLQARTNTLANGRFFTNTSSAQAGFLCYWRDYTRHCGHGLLHQEGMDATWLVEYYVLFFIHVGTRRVHIAGMTPNPDGRWMKQQARNMCMTFQQEDEHRPTHIIRDRDTKFTKEFCEILETEDIEFREIPPLSPNLNPHAESWIQRTKRECLDHFWVFGERHLRHLLRVSLDSYHRYRPHQGLGNVPIMTALPPSIAASEVRREDVIRHESLGGLLQHYERMAA